LAIRYSRRLAWHTTGNPDDEIGIRLGRDFYDLYVRLVSVETTSLYPGILQLIESLYAQKSVVQGALSNACGAYVRAVFDANQIGHMFKVQYGADDVSHAKPLPQGLLTCSSYLNVVPSDCIYIGDSPSDGQAAKAAGMKSIGVTWGSHSLETVAPNFDMVATDVSEPSAFIQKWMKTNSDGTLVDRSVQWDPDVVNNEGMNKLRTDDEYWTP